MSPFVSVSILFVKIKMASLLQRYFLCYSQMYFFKKKYACACRELRGAFKMARAAALRETESERSL